MLKAGHQENGSPVSQPGLSENQESRGLGLLGVLVLLPSHLTPQRQPLGTLILETESLIGLRLFN